MFFIAEFGSNWYPDLGKPLIEKCARMGVNAIKFQMWRQKDLYPDNPDMKKYELTFEKAREFNDLCFQYKVPFFCSVFYPEAVDFLEELRVPFYKIASRTLKFTDPFSQPTINKIKETEKPIIFSNGFLQSSSDIEGNELFCIPEYPTKINKFWSMYLEKDGISDHTLGITIPLWYNQRNPNGIIEKHVKMDESVGPDADYSINLQELQNFMILSKSFPLKFG